MPQKYHILESDYLIAKKYLTKKLSEDYGWFDELFMDDTRNNTDAKSEFWEIRTIKDLNNWSEKWLSADQWKQLKTAIRATRKRRQDRLSPDTESKHLSIKRKSWRILRDLAKHNDMTISAFIVERLEKEWLEIKASED